MFKKIDVLAPPDEPTITTTRWFAAAPERVWACWTRPELLRRWMGPRHLHCVLYEVDLRVGGGYRFVHRAPDGAEFGFHGEYREIQAPHRLVATFVFELMPEHVAVDTLTLVAQDGGTLATTHTVHASLAARDGHLHSGMEEGMADGYDRLDHLLGEAADRASARITPCLWFNHNAEEAIAHYFEVFGGGRYLSTSHYPNGALLTAIFEVAGLQLMALNGGPHFTFNEAVSLRVDCPDQAEIDRVWAALTANGGAESQCCWLKDRFGLSWQIVPSNLGELLSDADPARAQRAVAALMGMKKIDIAAIEAAKAG
jgi:predicted 3-demethylubiquinone-9 3-methyltransferase (glyoxalase superfamily)/uncharacterized protein YndB with AHSA1/START domain